MDELLQDLKNKIMLLGCAYRSTCDDIDDCDKVLYEAIKAAARVYERSDIMLFMPMGRGKVVTYRENGRNYVPLFMSRDESFMFKARKYRKILLKDVSEMVCWNRYYYSRHDTPVYQRYSEMDYAESDRYAEKYPKYDGIVLNPYSAFPFFIEGWVHTAIVYIGCGCESRLRD